MISQDRYVKIVSGVGAGQAVSGRRLNLRVMTRNVKLTQGVTLEASNADGVMDFFGSDSEEYKRAAMYFAFINKAVQAPSVLSFARWADTAVAPVLIGDSSVKDINALIAVSAGTLIVNVDGSPTNVAGINLSTSTSFAQVATAIQSAIRSADQAPAQLLNATVTFNAVTNQFVLTGAVTGSGTITITASGSPNDISTLLGWASSSVVSVPGQQADTPQQAVARSVEVNNNFGSFVFAGADLTVEQITAVATWNYAQNNMYIYSLAATLTAMVTISAAVKGIGGTCLNIRDDNVNRDYIDQAPCEILASTDFSQPGASQNYMYYEFSNRRTTIFDTTSAKASDALRANYIGVTQTAGQRLAFYQRGLLTGGSRDAVDINVYANEMWLKSAITSTIMALFLSVGAVPASNTGAAQIAAVLQPVIDLAITNGTFSFGKTIDAIKQQYITQVTGDNTAWRQVQTIGYWLNIGFESEVNSDTQLTEWKAWYVLVYSKGDMIRSVEGRDIMI